MTHRQLVRGGVDVAKLSKGTRAMLDALAELEALNPLARYWLDPAGAGGMSPGQHRFHVDPARQRFLRCANKVGKTYALSAEVWAFLLGQHPFRREPQPPLTVLYVVSDLDSSYADDVCKRLRELEPHGVLHPSCSYDAVRGYYVRGRRGILLGNGSQVIFRSGQQDGGALAGISADVVVINEPPKRARWGEIMRAAAESNAPVIMGFTPIDQRGSSVLDSLGWLRGLVEASDSQWSQTVIRLTPEEVPHRSAEDIAAQVADVPPWERPQRVDGAWEGVSIDRLFEGFVDQHVREGGCVVGAGDLPEHEVHVGIALDHGESPGNEVCLLYLYWRDEGDRRQRVMVLDEYVSKGRTTVAMDAQAVADMLQRYGLGVLHVDRAHGDVNTMGKSQLSTVNEALAEAFADLERVPREQAPITILRPRKGPGSVMYGCRVLNHAFLQGRLVVHERCGVLIHALRNWQGGKSGVDGDLSHTIDALRYGCVELLDIVDRSTPEIMVS